MGMSTHVYGFRPPDDKFEKFKEAWYACKKLGLQPPDEVVEFFGDEEPDPQGVEVDIKSTEYLSDSGTGIEVRVEDLPADVAVIRFVNSW